MHKLASGEMWHSNRGDIGVLVMICLQIYSVVVFSTFLVAIYMDEWVADALGIPSALDPATNVVLAETTALFTPVVIFNLFATRAIKSSLYGGIGRAVSGITQIRLFLSAFTRDKNYRKAVKRVCLGVVSGFMAAAASVGLSIALAPILLDPKTQERIAEATPFLLAIVLGLLSRHSHFGSHGHAYGHIGVHP